ncbi:MAG TPA: PAS domain S-box protein, partial [Candidatus Hydrogenedentes bacterium]|nr:PAS domain S-box protein [Candidatus Hydrogenedentota bacterium]
MVIDVVAALYGVAFLLILLPGIYFAWHTKKSNGRANHRARRLVMPLGALALFIGGCWASYQAGKNADYELRRHLISETTAVAQTINPIRIRDLRFDKEDIANPVFLRLRSQLRAYAQATSLAYIFSVARINDAYVFGPESIADDHPLASPPGTKYELPPKELETVFTNRDALSVGPYTDEFGTFVSAFVPVIDPASGMVVLALGADIAADSWKIAIIQARIRPLLFSLALLAVLAIGNAALNRRQSFPLEKQRRWRYIEAALCAVTGAAITLAVASLTHDAAKRGRYDSFSTLARAHAGAVTESMHDMRMRLDSLASFFESSEIVDAEEFASFTEVLARDGLSQSWEWTYAIPASSRETFEAKAGAQGLTNFFVWERNEKREKIPVKERDIYYPVLHVAPVHGNESVYGYDVGSEQVRYKALKESLDTGLATGTEPVILVQEPGMQQGMLAFRPVFKDNMPYGFALVTFRFRPMLHHAVTRAGQKTSGITVEMFQLQENAPPLFLASSSNSLYPGYFCDRHQQLNALCIHVPLFVFGNTYVLVARPESEWLSAHPLWVGWATTLAGLIITAILTAFIVSLSNRRAFLEEKVVQRTNALQKSENLLFNERAKFKRILDNMPIGIYMVTQDYEIRYMNPALQNISVPVEGEKCHQCFYGQDKPCDWCVNDKVFQGESARWECTFPGNGRIYEVYDTPITDADGVRCKLSVFHDITDIKEAQEALRVSEARTAATLRSIGDGVIGTDMTGKIMGINAAAERLTGWPADEAEGRPISEVLHIMDGATKEEVENPVWEILKEGVPVPTDDPLILVARDGVERYIADNCAPIRTLNDEIIGAVLVFRDITKEYAMQRELHENDLRMNAVISAAQDGIIMLTAEGNISMWNDASTRIFGYERGEVMGKNLHLLLAPKRYHDDCRRAFTTFQKTGTGDAIGHIKELTALRKNGREFPMELSLSAVQLGGEWHAVGIVRDITARKQAEQEML